MSRELPPDISADPQQAARYAGGTREGDIKPDDEMIARLGKGSIEDRLSHVESVIKQGLQAASNQSEEEE